jgi:hypothetical protein
MVVQPLRNRCDDPPTAPPPAALPMQVRFRPVEVGTVGVDRPGRVAWCGPDVVLGVGLAVAAFLLRQGGSASDGLWYDDAWVAIGAVKGSIAEIPMTGGAHGGYTLLLWLQHHVLGGDVERLVLPTFLFGVIGPAIVYGCLRSLRYERAGSLLAAAALVVTPSHITYSGRVKSYTLDVVLVAVLAALLPRLSERRWTWTSAAGWVAFAVALGSISGYVMVATAVSIGILVLHPHDDRPFRAAALVVQCLIQGGWVLYTRRFADLDEIEAFMEAGYDAHVERSANPFVLGQNLLRHLERVVDVHPGAPMAFLGLLAVGVLAGLVLGAAGGLDRPRAIVSRFALATLVLAAVGGLLGRFPFGPRTFDLSSAMGAPGSRHSLWLIPVTAIGLCNVVDRAVQHVKGRPVAAYALRVAVVLWTVALLISRWSPAEPYLAPGRRHLAAVVEQAADQGAYIVLDEHTSYQFFVVTGRPVHLEPTPEEMVGFVPVPDPEQGVVLGPALVPDDVVEVANTTDRDLLVVYGLDLPYRTALEAAGWARESTEAIGGLRVTVWSRT